MRNKRTPRILSLEKALRILGLFSDSETKLGVTEVARRLNLSKSVVARVLFTLEHYRIVQQDGVRGLYSIGPRVFELGTLYARNVPATARAEPVLETLMRESGCTSQFMVREGEEVLIVMSRESSAVVRVAARLGSRLPMHATASGKAIMSQWTDAAVDAFLQGRALRRYTPRTITSPRRLVEELQRVRQAGCATQNQEYTPGVFAVAAPVPKTLEGVEAAITVSTTPNRASPREVRRLAQLVMGAVGELRGRVTERGVQNATKVQVSR